MLVLVSKMKSKSKSWSEHLAEPERISNIVSYIREHFDQKTKRNSYYQLKDRRLAGFNAIFAVASIEVA